VHQLPEHSITDFSGITGTEKGNDHHGKAVIKSTILLLYKGETEKLHTIFKPQQMVSIQLCSFSTFMCSLTSSVTRNPMHAACNPLSSEMNKIESLKVYTYTKIK